MASRSDAGTAANAPAESVATTLSAASFVRLVPRPDGDGLAAAGLLARALRDVDVPFQVRVDSLGADAPTADDDGVLVGVGSDVRAADVTLAPGAEPASLRAYQAAIEMTRADDATEPDPVLALAGVVAGGAHPGSAAASLVEAAEEAGVIARRPGVAIPGDDPVDGLVHSTLVHAPFSGDRDATAAALSSLSLPNAGVGVDADDTGTDVEENTGDTDTDVDAETRRSIASAVALAVASDDDSTPRAATGVERILRPYATPEGPMATLGGFADVLNAAARERPGTGVALALGHGGRDSAIHAWREHGSAVHGAIDATATGRYDGVFVVRPPDELGANDAPGRLATLASLVRDFRSPEPVVVALGDDVAALSTRESGAADAAATLAAEFSATDPNRSQPDAAFPSTDAAWTGGPTRALVRFDADAADADVIAAVRETAE